MFGDNFAVYFGGTGGVTPFVDTGRGGYKSRQWLRWIRRFTSF